MNDDDVARRLLADAGLLDPTPDEQARDERGKKAVEAAIGIVNLFPDAATMTFGIAVPRIVQSTLREFRESGLTERITETDPEGPEYRDLMRHVSRTLSIATIAIILMSDTVGLAFETPLSGQEGG